MKTAIAAAMLTLVLVAPASAQTTSTTSPTAGESPRPPDAFLSSASGEVQGEVRVYCWSEPGVTVCADRFDPIDPAAALSVEQGELLTLRFDRPISPTSITVRSRDTPSGYFFPPPPTQTFNVPPGNPTQFPADLPPGTHFLSVFTDWEQGDAEYVFEITVRSTTTTTVGPECKPGWGSGDRNHCHRGPPGQLKKYNVAYVDDARGWGPAVIFGIALALFASTRPRHRRSSEVS